MREPLICLVVSCLPKTLMPQSVSSVYLRNAFDMDPSSYIGRFVTDGDQNLDEASGMTMTCSQYITHRFVEGGGVQYNEILNVSSSVAAQVGVPILASAKGEYSKTGSVRVQYELTGKMLSEINDPEAFAACCREQPDQCSRRYIGEFLQGKGVVYTEMEKGASVGGEGINPTTGVKGGGEFSHGTQWQRGIEFPNPVYFAFKVNKTPYNEVSECKDWMMPVPSSAEGTYFVGVSGEESTEERARRKAKKSARWEAAAAGAFLVEIGELVKMTPKDWCIETRYNGDVKVHEARVLSLLTVTTAPGYQVGTPAQPAPGGQVGIGAPPATPPAVDAPPADEFALLLQAVKAGIFSADKLKAMTVASGGSFTCAQVAQLIAEIDFEADRLKGVALMKGTLTDPENVHVLEAQFDFDTNKMQVRAIVGQ